MAMAERFFGFDGRGGATLREVGEEHGRVLPRSRFEQLCRKRGMRRFTFYAYMNYSSIIERFGPGVYGLRGTDVDPDVLETLIPPGQRPVSLDHGWVTDHKIWIGYRISGPMATLGTFSIPALVKQQLQGSFDLQTAVGQSVGAVVVQRYTGRGLKRFFRRFGSEPGAIVLLIFDLNTRSATIRVGAEDLLEPYQRAEAEKVVRVE